ncbi:MmgE/PrpD family protein [Rhizobium binae]|uniref:MmgE/PrpD family protein n=1 Tax=Rhizobium binae TaxID=1138190 RepID=UPI001C836CD3|nr:MmgE/PrpD family protein [Rhizobium binae]MBX4967870.1 MmgE/PrpD family protein [Rhizobium binae]
MQHLVKMAPTAALELRLAEFIVRDAPTVSDAEVRQASRHVADLVGVAIAGTRLNAFHRLAEIVAVQPRQDQLSARIWGTNKRIPLREAGFINGFSGHILDFDDDETGYSIAHVTVTAATAAMVVADACSKVSGAEVIKAYVIGSETAMRLGEIINPGHFRSGWHASATLGCFAACAAAGRILGLSPEQMRHGFGMCASFASGMRANFGTETKALQVGKAVRDGIFAAELAKAGLTSADGALFGEQGFAFMFQQGRDVSHIIEGFGKPYRLFGNTMIIKAYPCCTASHTAIYSMLILRADNDFSAGDVVSITCSIDAVAKGLLKYDTPTNAAEAKFSMHYSLAIAALRGSAGLAEFALEGAPGEEILSLMEKIAVEVVSDLPNLPSGASVASTLNIELKDGRSLKRFQEFVPGSMEEPMSVNALEKKFIECVHPAPRKAASELFVRLMNSGSISPFSSCITSFQMGYLPLN